jgi:hypothetical protein
MSTWHVSQSSAGSANGTSLANCWGASDFNTSGNWGVGKINSGDTVYLYGSFTTRLTVLGSGSNASTRIKLVGVTSNPAILVGLTGGTTSYIAVIGMSFAQASVTYNYPCIYCLGVTGWLIQGNYFHDTYGGAIDFHYHTTNNNNIVRGNTFSNIGGTSAGAGDNATIVVQVWGDNNLGEYNVINTSLDRFRMHGSGNAVINNYYSGTDTSLYASSSPYPFHTDGVQGEEDSFAPLTKFLYERNFDLDNRDSIGGATNSPNGHFYIVQQNLADTANWHLVRFNVAIREAESASIIKNVSTVRVYNNTYVSIGVDKTSNFNNAMIWEGTTNDDYDIRNNTFCFCPHLLDAAGLIAWGSLVTTKSSATNHSFNTGTQATLPTGASPANLAQTDPLFVDGTGVSGHDNYRLTASSPLKATGTAVTTASGAGAGTVTLIVADAKRLFDGWSVADATWRAGNADFIKIGSGAYVQISSINYATNTVTLSATRTWSNGDSVLVIGNEDVGAFPYGSADSTGTITNVGTAYTVTTTGSVRCVEFWEDGVPASVDYSSPYQYTSSGGLVSAKIYALYASQTPIVAALPVVTQPGRPGGSLPRFRI